MYNLFLTPRTPLMRVVLNSSLLNTKTCKHILRDREKKDSPAMEPFHSMEFLNLESSPRSGSRE